MYLKRNQRLKTLRGSKDLVLIIIPLDNLENPVTVSNQWKLATMDSSQ